MQLIEPYANILGHAEQY